MHLRPIRRSLAAALVATAAITLLATPALAAPPPGVPGPPPVVPGPDFLPGLRALNADGSLPGLAIDPAKLLLPPRDLKNYPKKPAGPPTAAEQRDAAAGAEFADDEHAESVVLERTLEDGTIQVAIFEPAPGYTPETLTEHLRRNGVPAELRLGEVDLRPSAERSASGPSTFAAAPDPNRCANFTSRAYNHSSANFGAGRTCPIPVHWGNNGFADPLVRFNDFTGSLWPVSAAVNTWNQTVGIDSEYRYNSCPFLPGARCVSVSAGKFGDTGWSGLAYNNWPADGSGRLNEQTRIELNESYTYTTRQRRTLVCHELGHVLGLWHGGSNTSCVFNELSDNVSTTPNSYDYGFLQTLYSINR